MAEVVDDRLVGNVANVLHVIIGLGSVGLLLRVSGVDALQNADATRRYSPRNAQYRKSLRDKSSFRSACALLMYSTASPAYPFFCFFPNTSRIRLLSFVDRFVLDRFLFRFSSYAFAYCEWKESSFWRDLGCGIPRNGGNGGRKGGCFGEMKKFRGNLGEFDSLKKE